MSVLVSRKFLQCHKLIAPVISVDCRSYCYKPIKRPTLSAVRPQTKFVKNALSELSLSKHLQAKILATGPITVADYMREVLTNPAAGYYMSRDVFGNKGDFITSPEIGQIFGELIALWCLAEWEKCGSPSPIQLVEMGPGRGTLVQDVIRVLSRLGLSKQLSMHMVEVSPHMSNLQASRLCSKIVEGQSTDDARHYKYGETISGIKTYWYNRIEDVPQGFTIYLAHEFFDALPIHKFQKVDGKWREILVDIDGSDENRFRFVISKNETPMLKVYQNRPWATNLDQLERAEYSVETEKIVENLAMRIEEHGGFALIMDYGGLGENGDTFRAFKSHELHDPLINPGTADLTADVDFSVIRQAAEYSNRTITLGPIEQKDFLARMGGEARLKVLVENAKTEENKETLKSGYEMLTSPTQMGSRFKFFTIFPKVLETHLAKFPVNAFGIKTT